MTIGHEDMSVDLPARDEPYDLVGVGAGPANLALAVALADRTAAGYAPRSLFCEREPTISWHSGMHVSSTRIQTSFLKDLVTLDNPASRCTFINYLHEHGRLVDFANLADYRPSRREFEDYLRWVASLLPELVRFGQEVVRLAPVRGDVAADLIEVTVRDRIGGTSRTLLAHNVCIGVGRTAHVPAAVRRLSANVFHTANLRTRLAPFQEFADHDWQFAVVGRGQSAGEAICHLLESFPNATVTAVSEGFLFKATDANPFVNDLYTDRGMQEFLQWPSDKRAHILLEEHDTNYGVVEDELLRHIARLRYAGRVEGRERLVLVPYHRLEHVDERDARPVVRLRDQFTGEPTERTIDGVVLATGYSDRHLVELLMPLRPHLCTRESDTDLLIELDDTHRAITRGDLAAGVYLLGHARGSHGFTEGTLANLAGPAARIARRLIREEARRAPTRI